MHLPVCQQRMHLVRLKAAKRTTWVPPPMPMIELMAAKAWSDDMWFGLTRRMDGRCHSDGRTLFIHPLGPHHSTRGIRIPARTSNARRALRLFTQETSLCPRRTIRRHLAGARVYYLNNFQSSGGALWRTTRDSCSHENGIWIGISGSRPTAPCEPEAATKRIEILLALALPKSQVHAKRFVYPSAAYARICSLLIAINGVGVGAFIYFFFCFWSVWNVCF